MGIPREYDGGDDHDRGIPLLGPCEDVTVGAPVRARYGDDVVDRQVDPLLGGVYAARADQLSLGATMPALAAAARAEHTLSAAVRAAQAGTVRVPGRPVFATVDGGLSRLVEEAAAASGARISLGLPVRGLLARQAIFEAMTAGTTPAADTRLSAISPAAVEATGSDSLPARQAA